MKPVFQGIRHDPANGRWGDCHRAAIATVLALPLEDVPHFGDGNPPTDVFWAREREFLTRFNLRGVQCAYAGELADVMRTIAALNGPDVVWLLGGKSPRGTNHTVVCRGGALVHDPSPLGGGLVAPCEDGWWWVTFFVAADLPAMTRWPEVAVT